MYLYTMYMNVKRQGYDRTQALQVCTIGYILSQAGIFEIERAGLVLVGTSTSGHNGMRFSSAYPIGQVTTHRIAGGEKRGRSFEVRENILRSRVQELVSPVREIVPRFIRVLVGKGLDKSRSHPKHVTAHSQGVLVHVQPISSEMLACADESTFQFATCFLHTKLEAT
jgi:hypothetical protein